MHEPSPVATWLPIPGWEGWYEVADTGFVRSVERAVWSTAGVLRIFPGKMLRPSCEKGKRYHVALQRNGSRVYYSVSVLVVLAFAGPVPEGMVVCHDNGDVYDNRLANLRVDTPTENMFDKRRHGTDWAVNKAKCPRKHLLSGPNLKWSFNTLKDGTKSPTRGCLSCTKAHHKRKNQRSKGKPVSDLKQLSDLYYAQIMEAA